jgi:hypothetical protein
MKLFFTIVVIVGLCGCETNQTRPPSYVWYCHIAGGGGCTGEMIRCWDSQRLDWTDEARCAAVTPKPDNLVNNQSWPPVSNSVLYPGAR